MSQTRSSTFDDLLAAEPLPLDRALALVRGAALAVDAYHARQTTHGSISPSSFLVDDAGRVTLRPPDPTTAGERRSPPAPFDAEAASRPGGEQPASAVSAADRQHWSPQRRAGEPPRRSDDLFALGSVASLLLTQPRPAAIDAVLRAHLSWAPADRFASGAELANELERAAGRALDRGGDGGAASATRSGPVRAGPEPAWATARRVAQAREAHRLALAELPDRGRGERVRTAQAASRPLHRPDYPDLPLRGRWVALLVAVLCSVYLFPLYFMLFQHG